MLEIQPYLPGLSINEPFEDGPHYQEGEVVLRGGEYNLVVLEHGDVMVEDQLGQFLTGVAECIDLDNPRVKLKYSDTAVIDELAEDIYMDVFHNWDDC